MDAEEEFWTYVHKFPQMIKQFDGAKAIRPWTTTGRLQYGSKTITGPRYCLLSHAGFFIDPLYSTGLALTTTMVDLLAGTLLEAFSANDLRVERFEYLNEFFSTNIQYVDEMVGSSFVSFRDFDLWDAWFRVWVVANFLGSALNARLYMRYIETKDRQVLKRSGQEPHTVLLGGRFPEFQKLFREALAEMDNVRAGKANPPEAARRIRALFKDINYFPSYFRWQDPSVRTTPGFTLWALLRLHVWYLRHSPRQVREQLLWNPVQACLYAINSALDNKRRSLRRTRSYLRDMFRTWNSDWSITSKSK